MVKVVKKKTVKKKPLTKSKSSPKKKVSATQRTPEELNSGAKKKNPRDKWGRSYVY